VKFKLSRASRAGLELEAFGAYSQRIYEQPLEEADVPLTPMLENMKFLVTDLRGEQRLSLAGLLLFGKQPQDFLSYAYISAVRWEGVETGETMIDRQDIMGRLAQQIEQAEAFILRNTRLSIKIEGVQQADRREYPRAAIRAAVVNAVIHRDYSLEGAQILLYIFDNRLEIRSPGTLPNSVTLKGRQRRCEPRCDNDTV
jgi:ATP-dependent DNA helicase RecG